MNYARRRAETMMIEEGKFFNTVNNQPIGYTATATIIGIDGQTGRAIANVADGIARYQNISSSNQLGITSSAFAGKFSDGLS